MDYVDSAITGVVFADVRSAAIELKLAGIGDNKTLASPDIDIEPVSYLNNILFSSSFYVSIRPILVSDGWSKMITVIFIFYIK